MQTRESITQEIRSASDIAEIIGQYVPLKQTGRDLRGLCPFHQEKTPSFHVRPAEQYFKCFGCGKAGDVFTFLMELNSIDFLEARQILADRAGIRTEPLERSDANTVSRRDILQVNRWAANLFRRTLLAPGGKIARDYIDHRRISERMGECFELGFAPDSFDFLWSQARREKIPQSTLLAAGLVKQRDGGGCYDTFRNRLMFPILDPAALVIAFGGRTLGDDPAKYINSSETAVFHKSRCLYGMNLARVAIQERRRALVVEGYTDVIAAHQNGFTETVAPLGTALTEQHADLLRRHSPLAVLIFDGDAAGARAADRAVEIALQSQLDVCLATLPDGLDPSDYLSTYSTSEFETLLKSAPSALESKWRHVLREHHNGVSPSARLAAIRSLITFIGASDFFGGLDAIRRGVAVNQLVELLGVSRDEVLEQIDAARQRAGTLRSQADDPRPPTGRSTGGQGRIPPQGAEQTAALDILVVLLREPGLFPQVAGVFDPDLFADEQLRRIARVTIGLIEELGEISIADVLNRLESPSDSARLINLIEKSRPTGPPAERLQAALDRLRRIVAVRAAKQVKQEWFAGRAGNSGADALDGQRALAELHHRTREYASVSNFVGIRKLRVNTVRTQGPGG